MDLLSRGGATLNSTEEVYLCSDTHGWLSLRGAGIRNARPAAPIPSIEARVDGHGAEPGWSWDITQLARAEEVEHIELTFEVDRTSTDRYVVGSWMVA